MIDRTWVSISMPTWSADEGARNYNSDFGCGTLADHYSLADNVYIVTDQSPACLRKAVYRCARYFQREFGYDFVQYSVTPGSSEDAQAFLWHYPTYPLGSEYERDIAIGAAVFYKREYSDAPPAFALAWVWMHPYFRNKGILSKAWPEMVKRYAPFIVETPISNAMQGFLDKYNDGSIDVQS